MRKCVKGLVETRGVIQTWLQQEKHLKIRFVVHGFAMVCKTRARKSSSEDLGVQNHLLSV